MKKKININSDSKFPENFIGISSHFKDIQVVWAVNKISGFNFSKTENLAQGTEKSNSSQQFSVFQYNDNQNVKHFIIANKNQKTILFPEIKTIDYILISQCPTESLKNLIPSLLKSKIITGAFLLASDKIMEKKLSDLLEE